MFKAESTKENICKGDPLNITCSAEGKPAVHTYQLFQNNILVHTSKSFELFWSNATTVGGEVMYTCEANNTASTANTTRTVTVNGKETSGIFNFELTVYSTLRSAFCFVSIGLKLSFCLPCFGYSNVNTSY